MKLNPIHQRLAMLTAISALAATIVPLHAADGPYHAIKEIPIGGAGGFDYLTVDPEARRLYISHATKAVVVDIDKDAVVGEVTNTPGIHGIVVSTETGHGFTSNGREAKASMFDLKTLVTLSKIDTGPNPDGILYDPSRQEVYTFNGRGNSATVIDAKAGKVVATVELGGKPESAAVDPKAGKVFDNLEDKSSIVVIDTKTHTVNATWPIAPGEEASGMAIDNAHNRIFIGCHNSKMLMIDSTNGKVVGDVAIGSGVDANAFDLGTQNAFASCGDGTVTIAHEDSPDKLTVVQTLQTQRGARTMALDTKTHKIYLVTGSGDTFKLLVYGM